MAVQNNGLETSPFSFYTESSEHHNSVAGRTKRRTVCILIHGGTHLGIMIGPSAIFLLRLFTPRPSMDAVLRHRTITAINRGAALPPINKDYRL